ncbi:MAG: pyrimidine-nucleoside phosphorylase [Peptostreptococcaceae bacterium]
MRIYDIIKKKRDKKELTREEIEFFVEKYSKDEILDYQASAFLMAIFLNKMNKDETAYLTEAMMNSGEVMDLSKIEGIKVDKHSTGGVGDKTTITLAPIVASCGAPVAKLSGRGLGHTGGTLDKLESIKGFDVQMSSSEFIESVNSHKIAVCGQTADVAVADKKMYALRDVTATVEDISLISSSIMCKKLASGADSILLDVKTGDGAFMKTIDDSFELAKAMVDIGNIMKRETIAVVTDMDEPLGNAVGNSLEVIEAIETLKGNGPKDFTYLCEYLASYMLVLAKVVDNFDDGIKKVREVIENGLALEKLKEFIKNQGGDENVVDDYSLFEKASNELEVKSEVSGYIKNIKAEDIGVSALLLGAGRETKDDVLDFSAGIILNKKVGDYVDEGELLATIYYNKKDRIDVSKEKLIGAYTFVDEKVTPKKLIYGVVKENEIIKY